MSKPLVPRLPSADAFGRVLLELQCECDIQANKGLRALQLKIAHSSFDAKLISNFELGYLSQLLIVVELFDEYERFKFELFFNMTHTI